MSREFRKWMLTVALSVLAVASGLLCVRQARLCSLVEARLERLTRQERVLREELGRIESEAASVGRWAALEPELRTAGLEEALISPLEVSRVVSMPELDGLLAALLSDCSGLRNGRICWFRPETFRLERTSGGPGATSAGPAQSAGGGSSGDNFHVSVRGRLVYPAQAVRR